MTTLPLLLLVTLLPAREGSDPDSTRQDPIASLTIADAAQRLGERTGNVSVVLFFSTGCALSQRLFPSFVELARDYQARGVEVLSFAVDPPANRKRIAPFLVEHGATFMVVHVKPWQAGEFSRALAPHGIAIGKTWTKPLVAVRDRDGAVRVQGQGVTNLRQYRRALDAALRAGR